jgi:D-glycero-alpha-D-manno-heptose 1-phosphate guanylyltransferase
MVPALDALILCGGLGTRLRAVVADRPKGLAEIRGRPFLDLLIDRLVRQGLGRFVLCTGYGGEQIAAHYARRGDAEFVVSLEDRALGTAGAVRLAAAYLRSDPFLVLNGDSYCDVDYGALHDFHQSKRATLSIVVAPPGEREDAGLVGLAADGAIVAFSEKPGRGERASINAGIYLARRSLVEAMPARTPLSLERDVFPEAVRRGGCYGFLVAGPVVDIGTPERYLAAQDLLRDA